MAFRWPRTPIETLLSDLVIAVERAGEDDSNTGARADAMVRAQRALEGLLLLTLPEVCDETIAVDLIDDADPDAKILDARATSLGFEPLPRGMRFVHAAEDPRGLCGREILGRSR